MLIVLVIFIERLLTIKEETIIKGQRVDEPPTDQGEKMDNQTELTGIAASLDRVFRVMEEFPYVKEREGKKQFNKKIFGWVFIVILFSLSVIIREMFVEFWGHTFRNNLAQWTVYFSFYVFVLACGAFIIYLTSRNNPFQIFKLCAFGVIIMIQVPALLDRIFMPWRLPYQFVNWEDFFKVFSSFTLHPDLDYVVGIGHFVMIVLLMVFFGLYVAVKRLKYAKQYESKFKKYFILSRTLLSAFLLYIVIVFSSVSDSIIATLLELSFGPTYSLRLGLFLLYDLYFIPLFLFLLFEIYYDKRLRNNNLLDSLGVITLDEEKLENFQGISPKKDKYDSLFRKRLKIIFITFISYYILKCLIIYVFPSHALY